jgi:hypothetical protein
VPHVEEELINFPEHLSSSSFCSSVLIARSLFFSEILCRSLFVIFPFAIALFVFRPTASDYFFGNFKLLFRENRVDIFNVCAINLITLSKPVHKYSPKQSVTLLSCTLGRCSPSKSLQVIDVVNVWFLLSHLQNGMLLQLPQCISNSLEIKKYLYD